MYYKHKQPVRCPHQWSMNPSSKTTMTLAMTGIWVWMSMAQVTSMLAIFWKSFTTMLKLKNQRIRIVSAQCQLQRWNRKTQWNCFSREMQAKLNFTIAQIVIFGNFIFSHKLKRHLIWFDFTFDIHSNEVDWCQSADDELSTVGPNLSQSEQPAVSSRYRCGYCHQTSNWKHVIEVCARYVWAFTNKTPLKIFCSNIFHSVIAVWSIIHQHL